MMFLFYINDLPDNLKSPMGLVVDDTIAYNSAFNHSTIQDDLILIKPELQMSAHCLLKETTTSM